MSKAGFYAVRNGRQRGIYATWDETQKQVNGFSGAQFKKFPTRELAVVWLCGTDPSRRLLISTPTAPHVNLKRHSATDKGFVTPPPHTLRIYADGAAPDNGTPQARAGVGVFLGHGDPRNLSLRLSPLVYRQTNQVAEIIAALNAVRIAMEIQEDVTIVTDSIYVVKSINEWRRQWIASGWKTHLVNKKHLRELSDAVDARLPRKTYFQHVKGHGSCEGNIQADLLATAGAKLDV